MRIIECLSADPKFEDRLREERFASLRKEYLEATRQFKKADAGPGRRRLLKRMGELMAQITALTHEVEAEMEELRRKSGTKSRRSRNEPSGESRDKSKD